MISPPAVDGLLVIDKPGGMTSRAVVDRALRWFPRKTRMGHTGTLDPLATGVLVLCLGEATRLSEYVQRMGKIYRTTIRLGARSDSDDADGIITPVPEAAAPAEKELVDCLKTFLGEIQQTPPAYSAAKVSGTRAYDLARQGREVKLEPRPVHIYAIDLLHYAYPNLELEVRCGKGTYIRSLARDIGERLACGAFVQTLRRTRVGPFTTEEAVTLDSDAELARARLLPVEHAVAELSRVVLPDRELRCLGQGQAVAVKEEPPPNLSSSHLAEGRVGGEVAIFDEAGRLAVVARYDPRRQMLQPVKVFQSKKR